MWFLPLLLKSMRFLIKISLVVTVFSGLAAAQGPPRVPLGEPAQSTVQTGTPPNAPEPTIDKVKGLIKTQVQKAIDGKHYPAVAEWHPLTAQEKFNVFLHSTYAPTTFINAGVDVVADRVKGRDDPGYETGIRGWGQHYGINLATSETDVFFQRFLFPALLKQDPRYFRNPEQPFFSRVLYSMSRVVITRTDSGGETFNSSHILGSMASRALSDLYVPGQQQGLRPLSSCISFDLLRDAGTNLLHEFWPDIRHKFLHR